jgi:hypothetical protein
MRRAQSWASSGSSQRRWSKSHVPAELRWRGSGGVEEEIKESACRALVGTVTVVRKCRRMPLLDMEIAVLAHAPDDALHSDADATESENLEMLVQFGFGDSFPVAQRIIERFMTHKNEMLFLV